MPPKIDARDRLIIALDVPGAREAREVTENLDGVARFFKIGLALQIAPGVEELIQHLIRAGKRVFLDYKYYDVPETLRKAVSRAASTGVSFLTIHGPAALIRGAVEGRGSSDMKLFAVTVLTAMDAGDIAEMGYTHHSVEELVIFRARKALEAGCDGVIASPLEARQIKALSAGKLLVVTPGIRPEGYGADDQKRIATASTAVSHGADYLVVGRPILASEDPRASAERFVREMQQAFDAREPAGVIERTA